MRSEISIIKYYYYYYYLEWLQYIYEQDRNVYSSLDRYLHNTNYLTTIL